MKYETIKTFILTILVGISLLLSFALWNYQPNYDQFYDTSYVNVTDIGGAEMLKRDLIEPSDIIFHQEGQFYSFKNPEKQQLFYKKMQTWSLDDYEVELSDGRPEGNYLIEIIFPTALPMDIITSLFTFNDDIIVSNWSFERMFITLNHKESSVNIIFQSVDDRQQAVAKVDKLETYEYLFSFMIDQEKYLREYIATDFSRTPIYLPKNQVKMSRKTLATETIHPDSLVNALFSNPSSVSPNIGEAYFTDGQRGMRVLQEGRQIEFINPLQANPEKMDPMELLENSVMNINDHKGWTNEFYIDQIDPAVNGIKYRLYYDQYPVFDLHKMSLIEQQWRDDELYQYSRPLIQINNVLDSNSVTLLSGEEVIEYLKTSAPYRKDGVEDINIGYRLCFLDDSNHSITLEPNWFVKFKGSWHELERDFLFGQEGGF